MALRGLNDFHLFGPLKKHLDGKEVGIRRRREASRRLLAQTVDSDFFYVCVVDNVRCKSSESFRLCAAVHNIHVLVTSVEFVNVLTEMVHFC